MTLDLLELIFRDKHAHGYKTKDCIRAVVEALRDEFGRIMYPGDDWNRQGILEQFDQILAPRDGDATTDAIQSFEGEESDRHFSEGISRTERAGKAAVGTPERSGGGTAQHDHDRRANPRDFVGSHETGRSGDVGGQVNHGVSRVGQAAGGNFTNPSEGRVIAPAAPAPTRTHTPYYEYMNETLPMPAPAERSDATAVCEWKRKLFSPLYHSSCRASLLSVVPDSGRCPSCGKPISFKEAQR